MRPLIYGLLAIVLSSCISPKKAAERYQPRIDSLATVTRMQADTIQQLTLALERSRGGNDMLLETQNRLQDRLLVQDDEIERLQRSLSSTNSDMSGQIEDLRRRLLDRQRTLDSLINAQALAIGQYSDGLRRAANRLSDSLETKLPPEDYEVAEMPGEIILSIQEMVLFRPRSVGYLANGSEAILKLVTETLQQNPLLKLRIVGHTDNQPNPLRGTDNWKYGALRASKLADELATAYYVSPNRLIAASQGEYGPTRSNATEDGRTRNRRIDFIFTSNIGNLLRELNKVARIGEE
ncbi:flagellar motor protein MotB [Lewinella aquimaris]|uniref:Flagellar motor protein MotB n=1 Tax=Neolewinella aquimaris TaxID=1835722 RepID=A0A840E1X5_9BACT|nr:OmpA family protein [Neolewinella aquimaris]MBB4079100.1 flagellar motor protein MotB [Neolewinella aquimaris]